VPRGVLLAISVNAEGYREVLGFKLGDSEGSQLERVFQLVENL
jgi:transposase-like protein